MLSICYIPQDAALAEQVQSDLSRNGFHPDHSILIVLVRPDTLTDKGVQKALKDAQKAEQRIAPILLEASLLSETLQKNPALDLSKGYDYKKLEAFLKRVDLGENVRKANQLVLVWLTGLVLLVFGISIWSLATGVVAPPSDEYATEDAIRYGQIQTLTFPTLDGLMPRTTEDALSFPTTVEAANTRIVPFLMGTATTLPYHAQASQAALATAIDATSTARAEASATAVGN